jgi:hypothetical protein
VARDTRDARDVAEVERHERLTSENRHRNEWRWLGIATAGGALLGAPIFGILAYATTDDSGAIFSRGDSAFFGAVFGAFVGPIAGFVLWALWLFVREVVRSFSRTR